MRKRKTAREVEKLLSNIKDFEGGYPADLLQTRRNLFLEQIALITIAGKTANPSSGAGTTAGSGQILASGFTGIGLSTGTLIKTTLVVAIVVQAGVVTYVYRDKIADYIRLGISPTSEVTASPLPASPTTVPSATDTPQPTASSTQTPTLTPSATPTSTATDGAREVLSTSSPKDKPGQPPATTKEPTQTPKNTETPKATDRPQQTETPTATEEPKYTDTPTATEPSRSTETSDSKNTD